ncbi:MAG: hypothetical protein LBT40_11420 [Deltaproteobacteria bacterium]|jgi:tetratricopeptide (TPR) repeat protein|nr:hypothetical protein [Deltaproteobacteria bacterium]
MSSKVRLKDLLREKDAFQTISDRLYNFYLTHTTQVIVAALAVVLVILGTVAGVAISRSRAAKASSDYYLAYVVGDPTRTLAGMEDVRRKYGDDSRAGRLAGFAMVDAYIGLERYQEARELADSLASGLRGPETDLAPIIYNLQGSLAEQTGDLEAAYGHYEAAWLAVEAPVLGPDGRPVNDPLFAQASGPFRMELLNSRGRVALALGRVDSARMAYDELRNRYPGTPRAYAAAYRLDESERAAAAADDTVVLPDTPSEITSVDLPPAGASGVTSEDLPPAGASAPSAGDEAGGSGGSGADAAPADGDASGDDAAAGDSASSDDAAASGDDASSGDDAASGEGSVPATSQNEAAPAASGDGAAAGDGAESAASGDGATGSSDVPASGDTAAGAASETGDQPADRPRNFRSRSRRAR